LSAIPVPEPALARERMLLEGDVPSPLAPPPGCRFQTRCPFVRDRCRVEEPALDAAASGHTVACHFWREIEPPARLLPAETEGGNPRLTRLQAFFTQRAGVGTGSPAP
jgi:oligopeptide/dipeptide ABC transporter ATP-binding protein